MKEDTLLMDFVEGVKQVNTTDVASALSAQDRQRIKKSIASFYDASAGSCGPGEFWNWGMSDPIIDEKLRARVEGYGTYFSDGLSEQLYFYALDRVPYSDLSGKTIVEVGCGLGDGLNFLSRLAPRGKFIGVDLSGAAIERARERFGRGGDLTYIQGDAEELPLGASEVDAVINLESSHNYPDLPKFFAEVARVLKPGGYFSYIDYYTDERYQQLERIKSGGTGLRWLGEVDISAAVKAAVERRMRPDSRFRTHQRRKVAADGFLKRRISEYAAMAMFGSEFARCVPGKLTRKSVAALARWLRILPVTSYRHNLARKD